MGSFRYTVQSHDQKQLSTHFSFHNICMDTGHHTSTRHRRESFILLVRVPPRLSISFLQRQSINIDSFDHASLLKRISATPRLRLPSPCLYTCSHPPWPHISPFIYLSAHPIQLKNEDQKLTLIPTFLPLPPSPSSAPTGKSTKRTILLPHLGQNPCPISLGPYM